ncbi:MAG: alpha-tubulin suppressor-like RCC1 family protein [Gammaproteobacteria bacterium]|jgi:alpha-tubulin suppressor-like RCC1 family protein
MKKRSPVCSETKGSRIFCFRKDIGDSLLRALIAVGLLVITPQGQADSSSPRLAGYYDLFMAICDDTAYEWSGNGKPEHALADVIQVGVGRSTRYALKRTGELVGWTQNAQRALSLATQVRSFYAGRTGVFIIRHDRSLWHIDTEHLLGLSESLSAEPKRIADNVAAAAVGDSADYYATVAGSLHVKGRAQRGQYGDGKLASTETFVITIDNVAQISAHTGHALIRKLNGEVWGTGGNYYGPLSHHGFGDKAIAWGRIFSEARSIATGASHSVAIRQDRTLWIWGANAGLDAKKVMTDVDAIAAGSAFTIALGKDALWQWLPGDTPTRVMACAA